MEENKLKQLEYSIKNVSPLELASKLQEAELYDKKETRKVIDEVYKEFENSENLENDILIPIFFNVLDGIFEAFPATRKLRKRGLPTARIINECRSFSYDLKEEHYLGPDGYTEWKNIGEQTRSDMQDYGDNVRQEYSRKIYEDKARLNDYKEKIFADNNGRINATDEYSGENNAYQYKSNPDRRRNIEKYKHDHQAEVDHITPLAKVHELYKGNYALTDEDIKNIANQDSNYALTTARINRGAGAPGAGGKFDMTNPEFVEDQRKREKEGRPNLGLSEEAKENLLKMDRQSRKEMDKNANKAIGRNIIGRGTGNTKEIWSKSATNAAKQSTDYVVGNVILFVIKPLYYEIADIMKNGVKEGVQAETTFQALKIRFGRVKQYVLENAVSLIKDNMWEFVKGFISSLIEGIISLFVGIFKQVLKVVKEGIKIFIQAGKVLWGKQAEQMSPAEKGDAIIKILGGTVVTICGIGIEALLNKIGVAEPWSVVLSTMFTGIASTLFMVLLDRLDLFSVKDEKRRMRIEDIFDERINDIKEAERTMNNAAFETMRIQRLQFISIKHNIQNGIDANNVDSINAGLFELAAFIHVNLGYSNIEEFVEKFDNDDFVL